MRKNSKKPEVNRERRQVRGDTQTFPCWLMSESRVLYSSEVKVLQVQFLLKSSLCCTAWHCVDLAQWKDWALFPLLPTTPTLCRCHKKLAECVHEAGHREHGAVGCCSQSLCLNVRAANWRPWRVGLQMLCLPNFWDWASWFFNFLSIISVFVIIGKCSLLYLQLRIVTCVWVNVQLGWLHTLNSIHRSCKSVLWHSYPSFFMVPEILQDLEKGLLCGNSLDAQMLVMISVS